MSSAARLGLQMRYTGYVNRMRKRRDRASDEDNTAALPPPTAAPAAPPGWAPDPLGRFELRFWDGEKWTAHVSSWWRQEIDPDFESNP
jgi:Protein of unknown function (DUF2510)